MPSSEDRYYLKDQYECPECRSALVFGKRADKTDSLILIHPDRPKGLPKCSREFKRYYAPVRYLTVFEE